MNVLITGNHGFVGSHVAQYFLDQGHDVTGIDDKRMGQSFSPKAIETHELSLEGMTPGSFEADPGFDIVVHCAAHADIQFNWEHFVNRSNLMASNVAGTFCLLEAVRGAHVIFLSTGGVYGDNDDCQEDNATVSTSPYAASKLAGEALVQAYAHEKGLPWHVFRLGCVVGSHYHHGHIADFVRMAKANGKIIPKNDGRASKSFVHVADLVQAVGMASRKEFGSGVYNAMTGTWSPRDTIRAMGADDLTEWPLDKRHGWVGDPLAVGSGRKLRNAGWAPTKSIQNGVREALMGLGWTK